MAGRVIRFSPVALGAALAVAGSVVVGLASADAPAPRQGAPQLGGGGDGASGFNGEQLFATMCGWCHQGGGRSEGKGPKLAGTQQTDAFIIDRIKNGKQGAMPAYGKVFTEEQVRAILAYIRGLQDDAQ